jgi:Tol biopolymer transport system component
MNADGTGASNIGSSGNPWWSPDGLSIVHWGMDNSLRKIYKMAPNGTNRVQLTTGSGSDENPSWR